MTDACAKGLAEAANAADIEVEAADWLERKIGGSWNERDDALFEQWLARSPDQRVAFLRLSAAWSYADRLSALRPVPQPRMSAAGLGRRPLLSKIVIAAMLPIVLIGIAASYLALTGPRAQVYATAFGNRKKIVLSDKSQVELNTQTVLRFTADRTRRVAWLDRGEAFFQIAHDVKRPFVVYIDNQRVTVLGTKFLVRSDADRLEVAVVEGRVKVDPADDAALHKFVVLIPGEDAIISAKSVSVARKGVKNLDDTLGWRRGVLVFDNTTLADAAAQFNRYSRKKIVLADTEAARLTIGGTFPIDNVELFVRVTRDVLGLHVEKRGDDEVISR